MDRNYPNIEEENKDIQIQDTQDIQDTKKDLGDDQIKYKHDQSGPTTYLRIQNEIQNLEVDLIQFREKNMLTKYLSFTLTQENESNPDQPYTMSFNVPDEKSFMVIKQFFNQLNWNN